MRQTKLYIGEKLIFFIFVLILGSCKGERCEGFNLQRIPLNLNHYLETVRYSNGFDTLTLHGFVTEFTKESRLSGLSNPTCDPRLLIEYRGAPRTIKMSFYFTYTPENDYSELGIWINWGNLRHIKLDSVFLADLKNNKEMVYEKIDNANNDSTRILRKIILQNMRVTHFEFMDGAKWYLVKD